MRYRYRFFRDDGRAIRHGYGTMTSASFIVETGLGAAKARARLIGSLLSENITVRRQPMDLREWAEGEAVYTATYSLARLV